MRRKEEKMEIESKERMAFKATYQMGKLLDMASCKEDPEDALASVEKISGAAISAKLVVPQSSGIWYVFNGEGTCLFPEDGYGFESKERAWVYWLGLGCPEDAEIIMVLDPEMESERVFGRYMEIEEIDEMFGVSKDPKFKVLSGGTIESPLPKKIGKLTLVS